MYKICSQEYRQFFEEYNKFLHHYEKALLFWVIIETSKSKNVQVGLLYERAVEEHIAATNACLQLHTIYRLLVQRWLETVEKELQVSTLD
jgi:predicted metal-binding protein